MSYGIFSRKILKYGTQGWFFRKIAVGGRKKLYASLGDKAQICVGTDGEIFMSAWNVAHS